MNKRAIVLGGGPEDLGEQIELPPGQIDAETLLSKDDEMAKRLIDEAAGRSEERKKHMSPPGGLGLPPLLDKRRLEYGITDGAFRCRPLFDRILVYQVSLHQGETFGGGKVIMPEITKVRERNEASYGIVVAAGLRALDQLRSNGCDVGHLVRFIRQAPYRIPTDYFRGGWEYTLVLRAGDIVGSEDLETALRHGACKVITEDDDKGFLIHMLEQDDGLIWKPQDQDQFFDDY